MANRRKRPWKVFTAYRTRSFATQLAADREAKRSHGLVNGPNRENYYFDEVTGEKKSPEARVWAR